MTQASTHEARRVVPIDENTGDETQLVKANPFGNAADNQLAIADKVGASAAIAREEAELKTAIFLSRENPRDEYRAYEKIIKSCERPGFAEGALYAFPRGGTTVKGPSVKMARELARLWGNIRYGCRVVSVDRTHVHIKGYAHDLETNAYVEAEDKFEKSIQRKKGGVTVWVTPDERDLRELVNRRASFLYRNCVLQLIPPDMTEDAKAACDDTVQKAAEGDLGTDRVAATRRMVLAFAEYSITTDMLAEKIGNKLDVITATQLAELRVIFKSIKDGASTREDHFAINKPAETAPVADPTKNKVENLAASLKAKQEAAKGSKEEPPISDPAEAAAFQASLAGDVPAEIAPSEGPKVEKPSFLEEGSGGKPPTRRKL